MSFFDKKDSVSGVKKSFFDSKKRYGTKWMPVSTRSFTESEKAEIDKAMVVTSDYGLSCCFFMKNGDLVFQPMSRDSQAVAGQELDINTIQIITLQKSGEKDIERIME